MTSPEAPEALARLHAACFGVPRPWSAAEFAALLDRPEVFQVAEAQGFALGRVVAGEAELLTIAVHPQARRKGRGHSLLARFAEEARRRGADDAFLEVSADNAAALALYGRAGFAEVGRRPGYYRRADGTAVDALILRMSLPGG